MQIYLPGRLTVYSFGLRFPFAAFSLSSDKQIFIV